MHHCIQSCNKDADFVPVGFNDVYPRLLICACKPGMFWDKLANKCSDCKESCKECEGSADNCTACKNEKVVVKPTPPETKAKCDCPAGMHHLKDDHNDKCVDDGTSPYCNYSRYWDDNAKECRDCHCKCRTCKGGTEQDCEKCHRHTYKCVGKNCTEADRWAYEAGECFPDNEHVWEEFQDDGKTCFKVVGLPDGCIEWNHKENKCARCDTEHCWDWTDDTKTACGCPANYTGSNGICIPKTLANKCNAGQFENSDDKCENCNPSCQSCTGRSEAECYTCDCPSRRSFKDGFCKCASGSVLDAETSECVKCPENCASCKQVKRCATCNPTVECIECLNNRKADDMGQCTLCETGF
jgi:hypothetical protein